MKIFLICPVRGISKKEEETIGRHVADLEKAGHKVHWPLRDTNQIDPIGFRICGDNRLAIYEADEVHIYWTKKSKGSLFDFGMAFGLLILMQKKIVLVNPEMVEKMIKEENEKGVKKSFNKVLMALHKKSGKRSGNGDSKRKTG